MDTIDRKTEQEVGHSKLQPDPEGVSLASSTHPILGEVHNQNESKDDTDMMAGVRSDIVSDNIPWRPTFSVGHAGGKR
jgi:hypothetical protein